MYIYIYTHYTYIYRYAYIYIYIYLKRACFRQVVLDKWLPLACVAELRRIVRKASRFGGTNTNLRALAPALMVRLSDC